jgi:CubicO group peptidase (beta-lactamase class C family)
MKTFQGAFLCLIFPILIPIITLGQNNRQLFDSLVAGQFPEDGVGTIIYLSKGDQLLYKNVFGKANIELNVAIQANNVFRLGSITKQFTACAILKLAEENKLAITDDICKYIPDFPEKTQVITIEALLTHTSGIKNYTGLGSFTEALKRQDLGPKQLIDLFKDEPLAFVPGSDYSYSNSGYVVLGYIIEKITGKPYGEYINDTIFKPLGMKDSYYDTSTGLIPNRVAGYTNRNGHLENADYLSMTLPYAAGSLASTVEDIQKWYTALHDGKFLKSESLKKAYTSCKLNDGRLTGYGYGWEIGNVQGSTSVKHVGVVNGFFTYAAYLPEENLSISILRNCDSPVDLDLLASKILAVQLQKPYGYVPVEMKESELKAYQGIYVLTNGGEYSIRVQDGNLMYYYRGGKRTRLIPYKKDDFVLENSLSSFNFERDQSNQIIGFSIIGTGLPNKGKRKDKEIEMMRKINISLKLMQKYAGKYQFDKGPVFEVVLENNMLFGQVGKDKKELVPFAKHKFFARDLDASIIFNVDVKGYIIGLTKIQNGEMMAKKL